MYGGPGTLSPGAGPVFPYGSFTTQPLQGGPGYPATQYAPHLVPYSPTGSLTSLQPPAYGGAVTIPTSAPTAGTSTFLNTSFQFSQSQNAFAFFANLVYGTDCEFLKLWYQ
jgi:hypothetical protein